MSNSITEYIFKLLNSIKYIFISVCCVIIGGVVPYCVYNYENHKNHIIYVSESIVNIMDNSQLNNNDKILALNYINTYNNNLNKYIALVQLKLGKDLSDYIINQAQSSNFLYNKANIIDELIISHSIKPDVNFFMEKKLFTPTQNNFLMFLLAPFDKKLLKQYKHINEFQNNIDFILYNDKYETGNSRISR